MGHVDHGKTSLQDYMRKTAVAKAEAGAITQMISSSKISLETLKKVCGKLLEGKDISIPGILFIDTPGHAAFTNLRKRGGNLADIAILVIDVNEGIKPQTKESIEILKNYKTPFLIALNKVDILSGWQKKDVPLLQAIEMQGESVRKMLDTKLYELVGEVYKEGFTADRFDRIEDYTKQIAIVPCSAKTGEGIPELLMVLIGLAQRFLEQKLETESEKPGRGTVLEVKEEKGLGTTVDLILYDGKLKVNDTIVIGGIDKPVITKVRGLFELEKGKLQTVKEVNAAAGVKILAPDTKEVVSGMPLLVANENVEEAEQEVQAEVEEVMIETDKAGVIVKADSLGSLEALIGLLRAADVEIKKASVGGITKKDIVDAGSEEDPLKRVILGFNVPSVEEQNVKVIAHDVVYKIIEDFEKWKEEELKKQEAKDFENLTKPAKVRVIPGCIFRQSNPCVVGVEVLAGTLTQDVELIKKDGSKAGAVKSIQLEKDNLQKAEKGKQVAISLPGITAGRQVDEEDVLFVDVPESDFRELKDLKKHLREDEKEVLRELAEIKRKENQLWGV
jgi:translation initiation factor 5B